MQKMWVIEKFCKHIRIQHPKIHQKQTFFLMGQNLCWQVLSPSAVQARVLFLPLHLGGSVTEWL